jgi:histidinol-phosphate/aromatic aminotransferase/cobyric acid decarboxylase-like protein/choline kinase
VDRVVAAPPPPQAVILAAGRARRMRPLSDTAHKTLMPMAGTTILGRIMSALVEAGVERITVATGYRAGDIEAFLAEHFPAADVRLVHNARYEETNNVVSLSLAMDQLEFDRDVLVIECDLLFDPAVVRRLLEHPGSNVALVDQYRVGMDGTVVALRDGYVSDVFPADIQGADFAYHDKFKTLNMYRFEREFCRRTLKPLLHTYANVIDANSYYELVLGMLSNIPAHRIAAEVVGGERWVEVDDPNDLVVASYRFEPERRVEILDRSMGGLWNFGVLDYTFLANAHFPPGALMAAMRHALPQLIGHYGSTQGVLNDKLSLFLRCQPERIQVLHGAAQAFPILARLLAGRTAARPDPTFGEYPRCFPWAATYVDQPGLPPADLDQVAADHDVVVVVNPNNPTGTLIDSGTIAALARRHPDVLWLVDESFLAFSGSKSLVDLLEQDPLRNVVVLTSLSKTLGVPGLRLGYVYSADPDLIGMIGAELPIWNLSGPAEFFLELLIKFIPAYEESLRLTRADRESLRRRLTELPLVAQVHGSGGNFLLTELVGTDKALAADVRRQLLVGHNIDVKDVSSRFSSPAPFLRIAVRSQADNEVLLAALGRLSDKV